MMFICAIYLLLFLICNNVESNYYYGPKRHTQEDHFTNGVADVEENTHPGFYDFVDPFFRSKDARKTNNGTSSLSSTEGSISFGPPFRQPGTQNIHTPVVEHKPRGTPSIHFYSQPGNLFLPDSKQQTQGVPCGRRTMCFNGQCGGFPFAKYRKFYGSLFFTNNRISELDQINRLATLRSDDNIGLPGRPGIGHGRPGAVPPHDGDICCPTQTTHINNKTLINTNGVVRELVHFIGGNPALQQYIPVGICEGPSNCQSCKVEERLHFLLVMDPNANQFPMVEYDTFYLKSYCSCKNG